jgi:sporulation protein YlmC with PRC-barrel domain
MKNLGLTTASSVLVLVSGLAVAQQERTPTAGAEPARECLHELDRVKQRYDQAQLSDSVRNEVQQLSESARILGQSGRAEACEAIVESISSMTEEHQKEMQEQQGLQALRTATRVTDYTGILKASAVNGSTVRNMQNEELGLIEETVIDPESGEIGYVVLSVGGFLGVGERLVAVPWDELRIVESDDGADPYYVIEASKNYLEQRQSLGEENWPRELEEGWNPDGTDQE